MRQPILLVFFSILIITAGIYSSNQTARQKVNKWKVHDPERPMPPVVDPGPAGEPLPAPSDAIVLFDGTDLSQWTDGKGQPARWKIENGYMEVVAKTGAIRTKQKFGDCQLHIEWASPVVVKGESQGRGNSGVFLMNIY
jgi:hypothetical protein